MRIGIDLGGTKIEGIALDDKGNTLFRERIAAPHGDYTKTCNSIVDLVKQIEQHTGQTSNVGIGIPGAISPKTGLVKNANSTWLIGHPLLADLEKLLQRPVRISNDANCFALSEAVDGAGIDGLTVFGVILGTGTGGGLVVNKQVITGRNAIAGEWGHNPLPWREQHELPGDDCYCGQQGCIETYLCGPAFTRHFQALGGVADDVPALLAQLEQGDKIAEQAMCDYESYLARALALLINIIDPDIIVLGGGLSNISRLYSSVPKLWNKHTFSDHIDTELKAPLHGDSSGVRGAAWLWSNNES